MKTKNRFIKKNEMALAALLLSLTFFFAYADDIPTSGQAIASGSTLPDWAVSWAGVPWDVTNPSDTLLSAQLDGSNSRIAAKGHYIWRTGWIWNAKTRQWTQFTFPQTSQYEGWAQDNAIVNVPLKADEILEGDNYVLAYTCNWKNDRWYCGCLNADTCGRWQLQTFTAHGMTDAISEDMAKYLTNPASVPNFEEIAQDVVVDADVIATDPRADFNSDGAINFGDFFLFADAFGKPVPPLGGIAKFDLSGNGRVDFDDFFRFADEFGKKTGLGTGLDYFSVNINPTVESCSVNIYAPGQAIPTSLTVKKDSLVLVKNSTSSVCFRVSRCASIDARESSLSTDSHPISLAILKLEYMLACGQAPSGNLLTVQPGYIMTGFSVIGVK